MFETMTAAQYRSLDADAFEARRAEVQSALEDPEGAVATDVLLAEADLIKEEHQRRSAALAVRNANALKVASGHGTVVSGQQAVVAQASARTVAEPADPFDTPEYTRAFMEYVCRGKTMPDGLVMPGQLPANVRADAFTMTTDAATYIPTTLMDTILEEAESYGELWAMLTKTNVQGGIWYNVWDFEPEAEWIGEDKTSSDAQKYEGSEKVEFSYHQLEVKLAQTYLASITTLSAFQAKFPEVAMRAIIKKLEDGYLNGSGSGQMLGILNDDRVTNEVSMGDDAIGSWASWHTDVKRLMKKSYRDGVFIMSQGTFDSYIDGMVDANGQPVARVNYGIDGAELYRFMGKQVLTVEDGLLPYYGDASEGDAFAVFTRPQDYAVNMQAAMRVSKWFDEDTNLLKNKVLAVVDGKLLRPWGTIVIKKG